MMKRLYLNKSNDYFSLVRRDIIELIPSGKNKILEIGCGKGFSLLEMKKTGKAEYTVGVDIIDSDEAKRNMDEFYNVNIENYNLPFNDYFDIIVCGDVLEHLVDPWRTVKKLKTYLKTNGLLIASIPNIREIRVLATIFLKGSFEYHDSGILDKTHLRFFCKKDMIKLFKNANFKIEKIHYNLYLKGDLLNKLSFGFLEEFLVSQYLIVAKKV